MTILWGNTDQDVIEVDQQLANVLDRQRALADLEIAIAEMLYRARALFIGGLCLPWGTLTPGKQREYIMEAKRLIQEVE